VVKALGKALGALRGLILEAGGHRACDGQELGFDAPADPAAPVLEPGLQAGDGPLQARHGVALTRLAPLGELDDLTHDAIVEPRSDISREPRASGPWIAATSPGEEPGLGMMGRYGQMRRSLAVAAGLWLTSSCGALADGTGATSPASPAKVSPAASEQQAPFTPATYEEGDSVVMPVTFPDGTTAELVYAPELDLADFRVQPYSSGYGPGFARDFLVYDRPLAEVIAAYENPELLAEYEDGRGGIVGFWRLPPDGIYLAFEFGSWTVLVYDYGEEGAQMSDEDRSLWATNFHGRDAEDGFLLLEAEPPLTLARAGEHAGPELEFWSRSGDFTAVLLFPGECAPYREGEEGFDDIQMDNGLAVSRESDDFASWCIPDEGMTVHVYQEPGDDFIDAVLSGFDVRNVGLSR
jgi:hypothetical protein